MRKQSKFFLVLFVLLALFALPVQAKAAQKTYTIATGNTRVYSTSALNSGSGWIYDTDEVTLLEIAERYCKVSYPTSKGAKTGYIYTNAVITQTSGKVYTSRANITAYRRPGGKSYGSVYKGDQVVVLGTLGSYIQVRYPVSGGYKFAFITLSAYNSYVKPQSYTPTPAPTSDKGTPGCHDLPDGWYMIVSGNSTNLVLDINNWNMSNGGNLEVYTKNNTTNQRFYLKYLGNGYYSIQVLHSKKYLHVASEMDSGANVHQWDGYDHPNAQWALKPAGNGYYYLQCRSNGSYLDNANASTVPGNNVKSHPFNQSYAQRWAFLSTSDGSDEMRTLSDGWYTVQSGNDNAYVWDVHGGGNNDGANLEVHKSHGGDNQTFFLRYLNNGYYAIMVKSSSKYLHKENAGYKDNVVQWGGYSTGAIQTQWAISSAGNGYYYVRAKAGNYVDNSSGLAKDGNSVITYNWNKTAAQKWKFVSKSDVASTLSLSGASVPGSIEEGSGFTCRGTISSNYKIEKVTVGIWDANNNEVSVTSRTPNSYSFDIKSLDSDVHFSYAKPGRNHYEVWAQDARQTKCLLDVWFEVKESSGLVSGSELSSWASKKNIATGSNAYNALLLINTRYAKDSRIRNNANGLNIFLFEGVGASSNTGKRMNAMCVVVQNRKIVYLNKYCQTIPDNPFKPSLNDGTDVPTVISGIYDVVSKNHQEKKTSNRYVPYAALNVVNPKVLRFNANKVYYESTSTGINVHARAGQRSSSSKNSVGCQVIGDVFSSYPAEYTDFIKAVGVVNQGTKVTKYTYCDNMNIRGKLVVDRTYARDYLSNIGYPEKAIDIIVG